MKYLKSSSLFLFLIAASLSLTSCGKDEEPKPEETAIGSAIITLGDGQTINFKANYNSGISLQQMDLGIGIANINNGMMVYFLMTSGEPITEPGEYNGYITLRQLNYDDILTEQYNSHYSENPQTGETGNCKLTITAINNDKVQGTFSGTLYSGSGKKATISKGVFNITIDQKY